MNNLLDYSMFDRMYIRVGQTCDFQEEIMEMVNRRIDIFAEYSFLPPRLYLESIDLLVDKTKLLDRYGPNRVTSETTECLRTYMAEILEKINNNENILIHTGMWNYGGFISAKIMEEYVTRKLIDDAHFGTILYIDTDLLLADYRQIFIMKDGLSDYQTQFTYTMEVLHKLIFTADYVFWDKFSMVGSNYEHEKLFEIITRRFRSCLGNVFITCGGDILDVIRQVNGHIFDVMNLPDDGGNNYDMSSDVYYIERCKRDND